MKYVVVVTITVVFLLSIASNAGLVLGVHPIRQSTAVQDSVMVDSIWTAMQEVRRVTEGTNDYLKMFVVYIPILSLVFAWFLMVIKNKIRK